MTMLLGRRGLLRAGLAATALPGLRGLAFAAPAAREVPLLILVSLRGGMDGLHFLSPADDRDFTELRIAPLRTAAEGERAGARLDASREVDFRLHPEAAPLATIWREGRMAIWPAAGVPLATRSHFEAQALMGWGQGRSGEAPPHGGWLAAWAEGLGSGAPVIALSGQDAAAAALVGGRRTLTVPTLAGGLEVPGGAFGEAMLQALHGQAAGPAAEAGRQALASLASLDRALPRDAAGHVLPYAPAAGVDYGPAAEFGRGLATVAQVAKLDPGLTAAAVDLGGWDTHDGQAGRFANRARVLAQGLAALDADLRDLPRRWTVLVASEFGRRLRANRSNGTDHGRAGVMFAFGGGGHRPFGLARQFGPWPGLSTEALEEGVDLRVATDYRDTFRQVVAELAPGGPVPFART
ncbi:DUF1501 domain-containing protein [Paracraurococcus lichenis]|uniref:DUF1501 domain-containing protein n=1 Tax=Paracraurococcus lichenis TaxID=3064888 RepID=A0ABT9DVT2_9PROT|nr:DUF1501 domain-containing protein [Paracraurococcus sp. LOR1-02]MDO9708011.1 DUF1501 domain-containing protein [Paracraurococcus sp. LOR1-02]